MLHTVRILNMDIVANIPGSAPLKILLAQSRDPTEILVHRQNFKSYNSPLFLRVIFKDFTVYRIGQRIGEKTHNKNRTFPSDVRASQNGGTEVFGHVHKIRGFYAFSYIAFKLKYKIKVGGRR